MQITINGKIINYSLEEEQTVGEVIKEVSAWLESEHFVLETITIDYKMVSVTDTEWQDKPIDSIETLEIGATPYKDRIVNQLTYLQDYLALLKNPPKSDDGVNLKHIAEGYGDFRTLLSNYTNLSPTSPIPEIEKAITDMKEGQPPNETDKLYGDIAIIGNLLEECSNEVQDPWKYAKKYAITLAEIAEKLETAAIALQTGKDAVAMETIICLTDAFQSFCRCITWSESDFNIDGLLKIIEELEKSLSAGDTVLTGDLLEYELKPVLEALPQSLNMIK